MEFGASAVAFGPNVGADYRNLIFDPQTSGGLLVFCPNDGADAFYAALRERFSDAAEIGFTEAANSASLIRVD